MQIRLPHARGRQAAGWLCAGLALFALAMSARAGDLATVPSTELVRRLDSDSFTERGLAHAELKRRGAKALDALRQELAGLGPEARRRTLDLMRQVEDAELRGAVAGPAPLHARIVPGEKQAPPMLEIRPAAHCHLWTIDAVRIGQTSLPLPALPSPVLLVDAAGRPVVPDAACMAPWRLPGKRSQEWAGTIDCRLVLHHPCVAIREPFAGAKPAVGIRGVQLTVVKVERAGRTAHFTVRIAQTSDLLAAGPPEHAQRERPGVIITRSPLVALLDGLELRDAQGRPLPRASLERLNDAGPGVLCRAAFTEVPADGKGVQLVLKALLTVRVAVGFTVRSP